MPPKPKYPCGTCNKSAAKDSILCNFCNLWHHATPQCMVTHTEDQISMLKELCKEKTCWSCHKCGSIMQKLNGKIAAIEKDVREVKKDVAEVKTKQTDSDAKLKTVEDEVKVLKQRFEGGTSNTKVSVMSEMNQREMRKSNVIIHNLAEPDDDGDSSKETIQAKEIEKVDTIMSKLIEGEENIKDNIKFRKRIGKKEPNKPRPMLIGFKNIESRNRVMEASFKSENLNISIKSDLTKMQREENSKLRNEIQNLNSQSPSDESGDYRWKLVGPPELLRKTKVRDIDKWKREEEKRRRGWTEPRNQMNTLVEEDEEED